MPKTLQYLGPSFEVYKEFLSFTMRVLDYFTIKASYLKIYERSLSFIIRALDFTKMVLNRLLGSNKDNLLSLWVGKVKPTHVRIYRGTKQYLSMKTARGTKDRFYKVPCQWGLRILVGRKVKPTHI